MCPKEPRYLAVLLTRIGPPFSIDIRELVLLRRKEISLSCHLLLVGCSSSFSSGRWSLLMSRAPRAPARGPASPRPIIIGLRSAIGTPVFQSAATRRYSTVQATRTRALAWARP